MFGRIAARRGVTETTVGVDIGTTSVKAVAVDPDGRVVARCRVPHALRFPSPDHMEHEADQAWRRGPRRALARLGVTEPLAVAVSAMVPSLTAVNARGRPITPGLLYGDARGRFRPYAAGARGAGSGTGSTQDGSAESGAAADGSGEAVGFLAWTAQHAPEAAGYWPAPAVTNFALGRRAAVDISTAFTSTPLFADGRWDPELCARCGVDPSRLPAVEMLGTAIGRVGQDGGPAQGATLGAGAIDAMCEQLVAGADGEADVLVLCGTTLITWIVTSADKPAAGLYSVPHTAPGLTMIGGPSNAGGLFLNWVRSWLGPVRPSAGLDPRRVPVWSPYIRGERTPYNDPARRAVLAELDLTHGRAALWRAAHEATGFVVRHYLDLAGLPARRVVATGGGTRVDEWMQALADATGLPVDVAAVPEGAALGAAFLARMAAGRETAMSDAARWAAVARRVEPDGRWADAAQQRYARFRAMADGVESNAFAGAPVDSSGTLVELD